MDSLGRETGGGAASWEVIATVIKLRDDKERNWARDGGERGEGVCWLPLGLRTQEDWKR